MAYFSPVVYQPGSSTKLLRELYINTDFLALVQKFWFNRSRVGTKNPIVQPAQGITALNNQNLKYITDSKGRTGLWTFALSISLVKWGSNEVAFTDKFHTTVNYFHSPSMIHSEQKPRARDAPQFPLKCYFLMTGNIF